MDQAVQIKHAQTLRRLHHADDVLLLPNAWDAGSAALFADAALVRLPPPVAAWRGRWAMPMAKHCR